VKCGFIAHVVLWPNDQELSHGGTELPPANAELNTLTAVGSSAVLGRGIWINTNEKLPPIGEWVLLHWRDFQGCPGGFWDGAIWNTELGDMTSNPPNFWLMIPPLPEAMANPSNEHHAP
jgi:hypothetical protein